MNKCESCRKGYNSKIDNTDLNDLLKKAIEVKPEYVEPPPLLPIDKPVLDYKPQLSSAELYKNFKKVLIFRLLVCMIVVGVLICVPQLNMVQN